MNPTVRAILKREMANINDDIARAEIELPRLPDTSPECAELKDYIEGKCAQLREVIRAIDSM